MAKRDRNTLKQYFQAGKKPTEEQFADWIDSTLNQEDDKIAVRRDGDNKPVGGIAIGTSYAPDQNPPQDGLIVEGKVGIGNASPEKSLDVTGDVKISGGLTIGDSEVISASGEWKGASTSLWQGSSETLHTDGKVGIGVEQPEKQLEVGGDLRISGGLTIGDQEVINAAGEWKGASASGWQKTGQKVHTTAKVGIGVTSPSKPLDVEGDIKLTGSLYVKDTEVINSDGELVNAPAGGEGVPVGTIVAFAGETAPKGWFVCNGARKSKEQYKDLHDVLKDSWGPETNTQFRLPDLRGVFLRGWDNGRGFDPDAAQRILVSEVVGDVVGSYQGDEFKEHQHDVYPHAGYVGGTTDGASGADTFTRVHVGKTSKVGANESRPKNVYVNYIIKH